MTKLCTVLALLLVMTTSSTSNAAKTTNHETGGPAPSSTGSVLGGLGLGNLLGGLQKIAGNLNASVSSVSSFVNQPTKDARSGHLDIGKTPFLPHFMVYTSPIHSSTQPLR